MLTRSSKQGNPNPRRSGRLASGIAATSLAEKSTTKKAAPLNRAIRPAASSSTTNNPTVRQEVDLLGRKEAPIPPGARPVDLPGRNPLFPSVYEIDDHPLVPTGHGTIYLGILDYSRPAMEKLFKSAATADLPNDEKELKDEGILLLKPSENSYFVMRDRFGSGEPEEDWVKTYAISREELSPEHVNNLKGLRDRVLGSQELMTDKKAKKIGGQYVGGIQFERHDRAINISTGPRCYQLATTIQSQRTLSAPGLQGKVFATKKDEDAQMRFDCIQLAARSAIKGLKLKGPPKLYPALKRQAEVTALPRIGDDENVAWPAFQLNVVAAVETGSGVSMEESLGKFAGPHIDPGDHAVPPTAVLVLSEENKDVEVDIFYVVDLGIAWVAEPYSTLFFNGLHFHGGRMPRYKVIRTDPSRIFNRLTMVSYPPTHMISGHDSVAFAALPKNEAFHVGIEMRNPLSNQLIEKGVCEQANWAGDGGSVLTPMGHLNHFSKLVTEAVTYFAQQLPPEMVARVDRRMAMKMVSAVINNKRVTADDWELGPGWSGEDVRIGKDYTEILDTLGVREIEDLPPHELALLCNSDSMTNTPYGNPSLQEALKGWQEILSNAKKTIPVCVVYDPEGGETVLGGRAMIQARRQAMLQARKEKAEAVRKAQLAAEEACKETGGLSKTKNGRSRGGKAQKGKGKPSKSTQVQQASKQPTVPQPSGSASLTEGRSDGRHEEAMIVDSEGGLTVPSLGNNEAEDRGLHNQSMQGTPGSGKGKQGNKSGDSKILEILSHAHLAQILATVKDLRTGIDNRIDSEARRMFGRMEGILNQPLLTNMRHIWPMIHALSAQRSISIIQLWLQQKQLLQANMLVWEWLATRLENAYEYERDDPSSEIGRLLNHLETIIQCQQSGVQLDASDYIAGFNHGDAVFIVGQTNKRYGPVNKERTVAMAESVLQVWLGFPSSEKYRPQAWFTRELINRVGPQLLVLDDIWRAAHNVNVHVLGKGKNVLVHLKDVQSWAQRCLAKHPLTKRNSPEFKLICSIHDEVQGTIASETETQGFQYELPAVHPVYDSGHTATQSDFPFDSNMDGWASLGFDSGPVHGSLFLDTHMDNPMNDMAAGFSEPLLNLEDDRTPHSTLFLPTGNPLNNFQGLGLPTRIPNPGRFDVLVRQVELLYCFVDDPSLIISVPQKCKTEPNIYWTARYREHVQRNSDKKLPFRDLAISRRRIISAGGPFSPQTLKTRQGVFSAIVHRGITHNTNFLLENETLFQNFDEWDDLYQSLRSDGKDEEYFCNQSAYGRGRWRSTKNSLAYWKRTGDPDFQEFIASAEPTDFLTLYRLFLTLPAFGKLTAYLLAADYATAGRATMPTFADMGYVIGQIDAGGLKGLRLLGWPQLCTPGLVYSDVANAFKQVYLELKERIPPERQRAINFGVFFIEHLLCKTDRLDISEFRNIVYR